MSSPYISNIRLLCSMLSINDTMLVVENGVLIAVKHSLFLDQIRNTPVSWYVLNADIIARGLSELISTQFSIIDYKFFVHLTEKYSKHMLW